MAQPPVPDLTDLAEKYDNPTDNPPKHDPISWQFPFKSGLTPLAFPNARATAQEKMDFVELDKYQRKILQGTNPTMLLYVLLYVISDRIFCYGMEGDGGTWSSHQ